MRNCLLPCVYTAFVAETLPSPCASTASVAKTLPLPCAFTASLQLMASRGVEPDKAAYTHFLRALIRDDNLVRAHAANMGDPPT